MGNSVEVDGGSVGVTEFTESTVTFNEVLVVTSNFFSKERGTRRYDRYGS